MAPDRPRPFPRATVVDLSLIATPTIGGRINFLKRLCESSTDRGLFCRTLGCGFYSPRHYPLAQLSLLAHRLHHRSPLLAVRLLPHPRPSLGRLTPPLLIRRRTSCTRFRPSPRRPLGLQPSAHFCKHDPYQSTGLE